MLALCHLAVCAHVMTVMQRHMPRHLHWNIWKSREMKRTWRLRLRLCSFVYYKQCCFQFASAAAADCTDCSEAKRYCAHKDKRLSFSCKIARKTIEKLFASNWKWNGLNRLNLCSVQSLHLCTISFVYFLSGNEEVKTQVVHDDDWLPVVREQFFHRFERRTSIYL